MKMKVKKPARPVPGDKESGDDWESLGVQSAASLDHPRSWAIYGRSNTGKTTFSGTFPAPILLLDVRDQGTDSVAHVPKLDVIYVNEWEIFDKVYWKLKNEKHKYRTLVIDTVTQMQVLAMEHVLRKNKRDSDRAGDWGTLTKGQWGDVGALLKSKIIDFRDLSLEVVFIAQERVSSDDSDNDENMLVPQVGPATMPSVASHLNASVSIIGNTFVRMHKVKKDIKGKVSIKEEPRYCLRIGPHPIYNTKIRKPLAHVPPAYVENPTYADIIDIIKKGD